MLFSLSMQPDVQVATRISTKLFSEHDDSGDSQGPKSTWRSVHVVGSLQISPELVVCTAKVSLNLELAATLHADWSHRIVGRTRVQLESRDRL